MIALSYGERGESGELWKEEGQTIENVKRIRHAEAEAAAGHLGASFRCLDLGDYPLQIDGDALLAIADAIRAFAPDVLITHTDTDPFNPDHPVAYAAVDRARGLAAGAGVSSAFATIKPPQLFLFEPHQPELCNFTPTVHVDITAVWEQKVAAMAEMKAQQYLQTYYAQRGEQRGNHARRASGDDRGALRRVVPARTAPGGGRAVSVDRRARAARARPPSTRRRAAQGLVDAELRQLVPGSRACGPARTVRCGQGDNLMVHAAMARLQPGEVLVLTMPEPAPVALLGDLLATQAQVRGAAAVLVDAAVRDSEELAGDGPAGLGALDPLARRHQGRSSASSTCRSPSAAQEIRPGDLVVLDADGATVVAGRARARRCSRPRAPARRRRRVKRDKLQAGALSYELDGLRAVVERRMSDIAHLGPVELFTPDRRGEPALLRRRHGHGDRAPGRARPPTCAAGATTSRWSLKLTASRHRRAWACSGCAHGARRRSERRVAAVEATGLGEGWVDGDRGRGPSYRFRDPDGHLFELYYECERYDPPPAPDAPRSRTSPAATPAAAARSSASITSTSSPPTSAPTASSASTRSATACTSASSSTTAARPAPG